ncbi:MAG: hypothetical protein FJ306_11575, partial [Planctomycetes bacterium]|nr:hypothetical protein [Planctomycetota bacterium]
MHRFVLSALASGLFTAAAAAQQAEAVAGGGGFVNEPASAAELLRHRVVVRFKRAASEGSVRAFASASGLQLADRGRSGEFYVFACALNAG